MDFNILKQNLQQPFQQSYWKEWLLELIGSQYREESKAENILVQKGNATSIERFASIALSDDKNIAVLDITTHADVQIARNRVALRDIAFNLIDQDKYHGLLVFYHSEDTNQKDYRMSFISSVTTIDEEGNFTTQSTQAKRYSFLLGANESCTTAALRLLELHNKLKPFKAFESNKKIALKDINEAFSVEKLNNEFFKKYKDIHYKNFCDYILQKEEYAQVLINKDEENEDKKTKPIRDFVKKLLGRIVFLHFLQKKGWLGCPADSEGWNNGDKNYMQNLFANYTHQEKFYSQCLTVLFFQTLNTDRRVENDIASSVLAIDQNVAIKIPFLNGGLFDNTLPETNSFDFPVAYFNDLLEFFSQYNFTIDENSPEEQEVGIDPEMLGHIFENLLEENKDKGAFYTPKEIVHYMCQESLIQYLRTHLPECADNESEATKALELFIRKDEIGNRSDKKNFVVTNAERIEALLDNVKICDPAIGSGAFPMGMLQEIFKAKMILDLTLDKSKVKKDIIQNSIYGVDIERGAVDIARLRFWLSLVVDEEVPQPLPNLDYKIMQGNSLLESFEGIDLSNLLNTKNDNGELFGSDNLLDDDDQKLLQYLLNLYFDFDEKKKEEREKIKYQSKQEVKQAINTIVEGKLKAHFYIEQQKQEGKLKDEQKKLVANTIHATDPKGIVDKKTKANEKLQKGIDAINTRLSELDRILNKLNQWEQKDKERPYFLWHTYFKDVFDQGGFDIVIANPPYLKERDNAHIFKPVNQSEFGEKWHTGKMDFWFYFLHKAIDVSNTKSIITFITSRYWLNSQGAKKLIRRVKDELSFTNFVDIGKLKVFDNVAGHHMIAIYSKNKTDTFIYKKIENDISEIVSDKSSLNLKLRTIKNEAVFNSNDEIIIEIDKINYLKENCLEDFYYTSVGVQESPDKISSKNLKEKPHSTINVGDGVFVLTEKELSVLNLSEQELSIVMPYLDPSQVGKYSISSKDKKYLIYADKDIRELIESDINYSNVKQHLDKFVDYITSSNAPYGLHRARNKNYFQNEKVIFKNMFVSPEFTLDRNGYYLGFSFSSILKKVEDYSLEYLLLILNSNFAEYWFYQNGKLRGAGVDIGVEKLRLFPINSCNQQDKYKILADYLIFLNNQTQPAVNNYADNASIAPMFEDVANMMVYELYFTEHLKELELDVLQFIDTEQYFKPIDTSDNADAEANAKIIGDCYNWFQQQDNPIRNRIMLSNIKSPDIIKRINASTH